MGNQSLNEDTLAELEAVVTDLYEKVVVYKRDVDMVAELENISTFCEALAHGLVHKFNYKTSSGWV